MASAVVTWQNAFLTVSNNILTSVVAFLPNLLAALVVFLIGLILAKWLKAFVIKIFEVIQLSQLVKKSGFNRFLEKPRLS